RENRLLSDDDDRHAGFRRGAPTVGDDDGRVLRIRGQAKLTTLQDEHGEAFEQILVANVEDEGKRRSRREIVHSAVPSRAFEASPARSSAYADRDFQCNAAAQHPDDDVLYDCARPQPARDIARPADRLAVPCSDDVTGY